MFTVGCTVLLAGVTMLITPGPGWAGIFVGFAILATEFVWARRALKHAQRAAQRARDRALDPRVRRRSQVLAVLVGLAVAALTVWYLIYFDGVLPWHLNL